MGDNYNNPARTGGYTGAVALTRRDFLRSATVVTAGALTGAAANGVAYERHQIDRIVRDVAVRLNQETRVLAYVVEAENFESIHNHSAYAMIRKNWPAC